MPIVATFRKIGNRFAAVPKANGFLSVDLVKLSNGDVIPEDEPLMLIRARDWLAIPGLLKYRELCVADGCNDYILGLLDETIAEFQKFQTEHPERMKQPGVTRGK